MASKGEDLKALADKVIRKIENGKTVATRDLLLVTSFFENIGNGFLIDGAIEQARDSFQLAGNVCTANHKQQGGTSLQEKMSELVVKVGQCYVQMGLYNEAIYNFNLALHINPANLDAKFHQAMALYMLGEAVGTASIIQNVLSQPPPTATEHTLQQFRELRSALLSGHQLEGIHFEVDVGSGQTSVVVGRAGGDGHGNVSLNSTITDISMPAVEHTTESEEAEGACGILTTPAEPSARTRRRRRKSGSRSRSRSRSRQRKNSTLTLPPKPSKKELENQDRLRQKEPTVPRSFDEKFALRFACQNCYVITGCGRYGFRFLPDMDHTCTHTILMVRRRSTGITPWTKVRPRPCLSEMNTNEEFGGQFRLCRQYQEGRPCRLGEARCTFCHSTEERDIWTMDMKVVDFTLATLIAVQQKLALEKDKKKSSDRRVTDAGAKSPPGDGPVAPLPVISCPFRLEAVCGTCWERHKVIATQDGNNCRTIGFQHRWEIHRAFLLKPENELIRDFDPKRSRRCQKYDKRGHCALQKSCCFIHGDAEHDVFRWMSKNKIQCLEDIVIMGKAKAASINKEAKDILTGNVSQPSESPASGAHQPVAGVHQPAAGVQRFCKVCNESFSNQLSFDQHCTSSKHEKNLLTYKERPWRYRPPPCGGELPKLCSGVANGRCPFSHKPDMYNQCQFAHSIMELDEWKERTNQFKFKKAIMKEPGMFSYVQSLQEEFVKVKLESDMMMQEVDGVQLDVSPDRVLFSNKKHTSHSWTFTISSQVELQKVSLLLDESRLQFSLSCGLDCRDSVQVEDGVKFHTSAKGDKEYTVLVNFNAELFGSFKQKVIFDFGTRPLLVVSLDVEVGSDFVRDEILKLRKELPMERWTSKTHTVIPFSATRNIDPEDEVLLCKYKPPDITVFSQDSLDGDLNHNNYVHRMHRLVEMEELEQTRVASRFNVVTNVQLSETLPGSEELRAPVNHLFGCVPLTDCQLSEDSDAGYLMLHGAVTAWVGATEEMRPTVFEAQVVCEANFGFDCRGRDHFYICLSKSCCSDLVLKSGQARALSVQLQIDRIPLCHMHFGLDQLPDTGVVFPDLSRYTHNPSASTEHRLPLLNTTQQDVVDHMTFDRKTYTPPLVVYGPFGSGKTQTLARAAEEIIRTKSDARILICALNDSAADLYVTHYLWHSKTIKHYQILRVYSPARWANTVSDDLQPYCQKDVKGRLKLPDLQAVNEHKVIVTTLSTSLMLTDRNIRGCFSHIIIDEAGQCLECEAILPLTLATDTTCVVLAGDHRQLGPKSFSAGVTPKRLKLHISIIERLYLYYLYYDEAHPGRLVKMLKVNYRSHPRIMAFISEHFYHNAIECRSEWGACSDFKPLAFYATHGKESTDTDSTSYYNTSEVAELVEQITHLYDNWPESWGERSPQKMAVLTPYSQQVKKVIAALVKSNHCFKDIRVSTVSDIQGEEFHAVFLSTVRTIHHGTTLGCTEDTFGFFSDIRLVNTAITRAKCQVAVVGNPASLTSFGYCMNIWISYLDRCDKDGCLYPKSITLGEIRLQAESLSGKLETQSPMRLLVQRIFDIAEIEPDEIIQNLKGKIEPADSNNRMEIIERDQRTIYRFSANQSKNNDEVVYTRRKTKWKPVQLADTVRRHKSDTDDEIYSDEEEDSDDDDSSEEADIYQNYNEDQMLKLLEKDGKMYKRCIITIEGSNRMFARNMNRNDNTHTITIGSREHCNRSFDGDDVVVEIIPTNAAKKETPRGRVVGILKRVMEYKNVICRVDPYNHSLLIPLNSGIPIIQNLTPQNAKKKGVAMYSSSNKLQHPQFQRYETVDVGKPSEKLFIVRYLKWQANFKSPLGIVINVIPAPVGLDDSAVVLQLEYNLDSNYKRQTKGQVIETYNKSYKLPESAITERADFRKLTTFTIDPKETKDFDDALSLEKIPGGLIIGIHIADVSYFVPQDSPLDIEARLRCLTYYPPEMEPISMLPPRLSAELCSLQPGSERLSVSVLLHIDSKDYSPIKHADVKRGIICSSSQLTYEDAQKILDKEDDCHFPKEVTESVHLINQVAKVWRYERLGDSGHAFDPKEGRDTEAHHLIEEMMVRANHEVARFLTRKYSDVVPLQLQQYPNKESLSEWLCMYHESAQHSLNLPTAISKMICKCIGTCSCVTSTQHKKTVSKLQLTQGNDGHNNQLLEPLPKDQISITYKTLSSIQAALTRKDDVALKHLIATGMFHPELAVAELAYRDLQRTTEYRCSGDLKSDSMFHASLKIEPYTHFTSPIRRYIDIVAHRLVITAIENNLTNMQASYNLAEVRKICDQCNRTAFKQRKYEKAVRELKLNVLMKKQPLVVYPVVDQVQEVSFHLRFPTLPQFASSLGTIMYSDLNLHELPVYDEEKGDVILSWEGRIYNYEKYKDYNNTSDFLSSATSSLKLTNLNPNQYVTQIPALLWHKLLCCIKEDDIVCLRQTSELLLETSAARNLDQPINTDNESQKFALKVFPTQVHCVQLCSKLHDGRLRAQVQLVILADSLSICIEHRQNPITCFAENAGLKVTRDFGSVDYYIKRWKPLLKAEAAFEAVISGESYILKNVFIKWRKKSAHVEGEITLCSMFCEENGIFTVHNNGSGEEEYFCVRYNGIKVPPHVLNDEIVQTAQFETKICFVGHCLITERECVRKTTKIQFVLHQSAMPFPDQLLAEKCLGTIQVVAMSPSMRRMLFALHGINKIPMVRCLALGKRVVDIDEPTRRQAHNQLTQLKAIDGFVKANIEQERAVRKALTQPFTVIHGPPGTGKTVTGARIAHMFTKINKEEDKNKKILYCGPTNKSVEVFTDYLRKPKEDLQLVRVYSDDVVKLRYPDLTIYMKCPRHLQSSAKQENILRECRHKDIALHTLIRDEKHCRHAKEIREFDDLFASEIKRMASAGFCMTKSVKDAWKNHMKKYKKLISAAYEHVLLNADIVLVTCIGAATPKIVNNVGELINQLIIDEAGMCTEPESMVPLTSCNAKQVVLIGDHKQLQPIVQTELAKRLGMRRSMFERYVTGSDMLIIQYRMHEAIAKLPSKLFYDDRLRCGLPEQSNPSALQGLWAGGQGQPITFVDIRSEEFSQVVMTADGNQQSKYNPIQAQYTAEVVKALVTGRGIHYKCIQVLSQYRAHCKQLREELHRLGAGDCEVTTVSKSQGSEVDYVVLSTVRSLPSVEIVKTPTRRWIGLYLGTVADEHQVNVAITRARKGLVIIGNRELLSVSPVWKQLFEHYRYHRAILQPEEFLQLIEPTDTKQ